VTQTEQQRGGGMQEKQSEQLVTQQLRLPEEEVGGRAHRSFSSPRTSFRLE
jgi:hypothetical protein